MLYLITGLPGSGKTLRAIALAQELGQGRPVYVRGVKGLRVDGWHVLEEGEAWPDCPDGAVILLDEAQEVFRVRAASAQVPPHVAALEKHRHRGHDVIAVTQHPHLIDSNVRKLVGRHWHLVRNFALGRAVVYQWERCVADPTNGTQQKEAIRSRFVLPRALFGQYDSAVMHTHRKDFPVSLLLRVAALVLLVVGLLWYAYSNFTGSVPDQVAPELPDALPGLVPAGGGGLRAGFSDPWSPDLRLARLDDVPGSAPYFDPLHARPATAPRIAGCASMEYGNGRYTCECYSQQGTRLQISVSACRATMRYGVFDAIAPDSRDDPNAEVIARLERESQFALSWARGGGTADVGGGAAAPGPR